MHQAPRFLVALFCLCALACGEAAPPLPPADTESLPVATPLALLADHAHRMAETTSIDLGEPGSENSLGEGWLSPEELEDGTSFVWAVGEGSDLVIRVAEPKKLRLDGTGWPFRPPDGEPQRMTLAVNDREVGSWRMKPGLETSGLSIPARFLVPGTNRLTLRPSAIRRTEGEPAISAAWSHFELSPTQENPPSWQGTDLELPLGSAIRFFFEAKGPAVLAFDSLEGPAAARLRIELASDAHPDEPPLARIAPQSTPGSLELRIEGRESTRPTLISLTLTAAHPKRTDAALVLRKPALHTAEVFDQLVKEKPGPEARGPRWQAELDGPRRPNVLLYLIDTLRADRLGCYGGDPKVSPNIDALAAESVLFENTTAQSSWTRASMASIFTGLGVDRHAVRSRRDALSTEASTLAELLGQQGYATAGILTNGNAGAGFGFAQGFDSFELLPEIERGVPSGADRVHARATEWLDGPLSDRSKPFFLYLHTMEPHAPYIDPPDALDGRLAHLPPDVVETLEERGVYSEGPTHFGSVAWVQALFHQLLEIDDSTGEKIGSAYDAAITANDRLFGELLGELEDRGLEDETVVILLSDHGEELHDHGSWSHGMTLYEEQLRVPFLIRFPDGDAPRGLQSRVRARQVDLLPTLLDYLAIPTPSGLDGQSLLDRLHGESSSAWSHLDLDGRHLSMWLEGSLKLICASSADCALFDLATDPAEQRDLFDSLPVTADFLRLRLEQRADPVAAVATEAELDPETEAQLRALGYI